VTGSRHVTHTLLAKFFGRPGNALTTLVMVVLDALLINSAFIVAYVLRYEVEIGGTVQEANFVPLAAFLPMQLLLTGITILVFLVEGLYRGPRRPSLPNQLGIIFQGTIIAVAVLIVILFVFRPESFSRLIYAQAWVLMVAFLGVGRVLESVLRGMLRRRGIGVVRLLIVGCGTVGRAIMQALVAQPELGYQVVGFVDDNQEKLQDIGRYKALGTTADTPRLVNDLDVEQVIITLPWLSHKKVLSIMSQCQRRGVQVRVVPDLFQITMNQVDIEELNGIPLIGFREPSLQATSRLVKRGLDVIGSVVCLVVMSPILLITAIAIVIDSPGPAIFPQERVGQGGRTFTLYKFRSMRTGADAEKERLRQLAEAGGVTFKLKDDPRRTRVGGFLRRVSLDEAPQFYNVLRGEMSLVGPRPAIPSEVEQYDEWHRKRLDVKPGLTGLWQVMGRSELPFEEMVMLDIFYIENWSLSMDIKILLQTVPTVLSGRGAY
jgi:exopolysaccharide biosynthesis polyprenyl glycosylphosphotransferase